MAGDALAVGERRERTYFRRLFRVLGAKGVVVLLAFPAVVFLSSEDVHPVFAGGVLAGAFGYALLVDSESLTDDIYPGSEVKLKREKPLPERIDAVGFAFVLLTLGYVVLSFFGVGADWRMALLAAGVTAAAVVYDYFAVSESEEMELSVDVVGFAVAEVLVVYAMVTGTGWSSFAGSVTFGALAFFVYAGTVAAFAGHAAVTREVLVSRTDDEIHGVLLGLLGDIGALDDEATRKKMASGMRVAIDCLDGVSLPTEIEDSEGYIPAVVSTRRPDGSLFATDADEILETAENERFTGYVVYGENVLIFRNGNLSKFYVNGEYGYDADELNDSVTEATFHALNHRALNNLDEVTPDKETATGVDREVETEEKTEEETVGDEDEAEDEEEGTKLEIGGDEIDVEEMFEKADEIIEDLD